MIASEHEGERYHQPVQPNHKFWAKLVQSLRDGEVDEFIAANRATIMEDARSAGVSSRSLEVQIRLHVPSLTRSQLQRLPPAEAYQQVRLPALLRAYAMRRSEQEAQLAANSSLFINPQKVRRDLHVELADRREVQLTFAAVNPAVGHAIQKNLHYLGSPRGDTCREFGVFLPGAEHPITYVAFSVCDRAYMARCLDDLPFASALSNTLVLTRMYTLPDMPRNLISLTIRHAMRAVRAERRFVTVLTAFNPFLGFAGSAFQASGFHPIAVSPTTYSYDDNGEYTTRRQATRSRPQAMDTPPNILTAKGVTRTAQRSLLYCEAMVDVELNDYQASCLPPVQPSPGPPPMSYEDLAMLRKQLASAWSDRTIHPSYLPSPSETEDPRGQCGVSSVLLLKELRELGAGEAQYCYGDVLFDGSAPALLHHCWVEYGPSDSRRRYVIDITSDQSDALGGAIQMEPIDRLESRGVHYKATTRLTLDQLPGDRVWPRFLALRKAMDETAGAREPAR